jgi:hypothetical protein
MRIPRPSEIPDLDRQAIDDDVAPYRGMSARDLDEVRHALCRLAAEQRAHWPARARDYQDPVSPEAEALWRRLVQAYRRHERSAG